MIQSTETIGNRKYTLFRSDGDLDRDLKNHELVAVEYGYSIEDIEEALMADVSEDLSSLTQFMGLEADAFEPEEVDPHRRGKRYQYTIMGIVYGADAGQNALIEYGIIL